MKTIDEYLQIVEEGINQGPFSDDWASLSKFQIPQWYKDGRFGLFIHWGAFSVPATETEWYPRMMYLRGTKSWRHRVKTYGKDGEYRQVVEQFSPTRFDADEWLGIFQKSGAKYIMPVAEHHDGVKLYKSELNRWNTADMPNTRRDYMTELHAACDRAGMGFLCSNHRAEHFWFLNGARAFCPNSEVTRGLYPDLYGPAALYKTKNPWDNEKYPPTEDWCRDWLASACEMVDHLRPLAVYFDWWINKPEFKPYLKKFLAYYYNRGVQWGKEVAVFYKVGAVMKGCAVFDVERGQIDTVSPVLWQNDTAIAKNSWGYTEGNRFKTPREVLLNLIDVIAKNGCFMLNVGPKADGTICDEEKQVLLSVGKWMESCGEAIYGAQPYDVPGEGKKQRGGSFKENLRYSKKDYRFTYKPGAIYVFVMSDKPVREHVVHTLRKAKENGILYNIQNIELLGQGTPVRWKQDKDALRISFAGDVDRTLPLCLKVSVD